jgi:prepilin peptidase CpaA
MNIVSVDSLPSLLASLAGNPGIALAILVIAAAVIDVQSYRIPNRLTVGGMLLGLAWNTAAASAPHMGFLLALGGLAAGLALLLPLYALRVTGAGDVKLMAMVGAFLGLPEILYAVVCTLIAGGVVAVVFALYRRAFRRMAGNVIEIMQSMTFAALAGYRPTPGLAGRTSIGKVPYGVSIAVGTLAWLAVRQLGYA